METEHTFVFRPIGKKTYEVSTVDAPDIRVGTVKHFYITHLHRMGWEATASDGHRGVHDKRYQAAAALIWDGNGYPFPIITKKR